MFSILFSKAAVSAPAGQDPILQAVGDVAPSAPIGLRRRSAIWLFTACVNPLSWSPPTLRTVGNGFGLLPGTKLITDKLAQAHAGLGKREELLPNAGT